MSSDAADPNAPICPILIEIGSLLHLLESIREELIAHADKNRSLLNAVHSNYRDSAENLIHYLALRRRDLRPLQLRLASLGLSSLGRAEANVLATIDSVLSVLKRLMSQSPGKEDLVLSTVDLQRGNGFLAQSTERLLGHAADGRLVHIMVTMPSDAAREYSLVHDLLKQGMDCMRINCAHDDSTAWERMIEHLRKAEKAIGRSCRVAMDLAGPKLRTGPLEPGPAVLRVRPQRDEFGRVVAPAHIWLTSSEQPTQPVSPADACLPITDAWIRDLEVGSKVRFRDFRGAKRSLNIVDVLKDGCWASLENTAYITQGIELSIVDDTARGTSIRGVVGELPSRPNAIHLQTGDLLFVCGNQEPGRSATLDRSGRILTPASIGCTIPGVLQNVEPGEAIWFDDGKIGGVIEETAPDRILVRIIRTSPSGAKLLADKGINLPDSQLQLDALTEQDLEDLKFVSHHADIVEMSFANTASDVEALLRCLTQTSMRQPGIVLKIETGRGFENLPDMLLEAMKWPSCGVMIARGDLAVEVGFERLAEVQEEILWICEAAHVPVIWATQVLESLAKEGLPSRAEITDAAMGHRAECVMLNKGPHVVSAVRVLDDILTRMRAHQEKKRAMLRELRLARKFEGFHNPPQ